MNSKKNTKNQKSQSAIEYLIIIGFVTFAITSVIIIAYFYLGMSRDKIRENQIENLAIKIIDSAESVFYAGEPSQITISVYFPEGIDSIQFSGYNLIINASMSSGKMSRAFTSRVFLSGNINPTPGTKKLKLRAESSGVLIESV